MEYDLYEIKQYFKEYLIDHNLDKLNDKDLQTIINNNLKENKNFLETLVIFAYNYYNCKNLEFGKWDYKLKFYFKMHHNITGNSFELDKKFKGMFLNKNKSEWEREIIKKIYYHKLYDKIKDRNIE